MSNAAQQTESTTLAPIAENLVSSMPDVQDHAIHQANVEAQSIVEQNETMDKKGEVFDPDRHIIGADGKGIINSRGGWTQKRGRKPGGETTPAQKVSKPRESVLGTPGQQTPQQMQQVQTRAAGAAAAEMLFMVGTVLGGDEWTPMVKPELGLDERANMRAAFGDYFQAKGLTDIPPGYALTFCILAYAAPRFTMPKTQSRIGTIKTWITTWWANRKLKKHGLQAVPVESEKKGA